MTLAIAAVLATLLGGLTGAAAGACVLVAVATRDPRRASPSVRRRVQPENHTVRATREARP